MNGNGLAQKHIVHDFKARQKRHPLMIIKIRASGSLVDILCSSHRDNENIALFFCFFQMLDMAIVQEIEDPVTKHDFLSRVTKTLTQLRKVFFTDDFFIRHANYPQFPRYLNQSAVAS